VATLFNQTANRGISQALLGLLIAATTVGCTDDLSGHVWNVRLQTERDTCANNNYDEVIELIVDFEGGAAVSVATDETVFATGAIAGCSMTYQTGAWEEDRGNGIIRWELRGEANYRLGGTACEISDGLDWEGSETFTVLSSEDPDIETGCEAVLNATGTYVGER
jgi:hypothetical protein